MMKKFNIFWRVVFILLISISYNTSQVSAFAPAAASTESATYNLPTNLLQAGDASISQVKITNVKDGAFVVSWITQQDETGSVHYGTTAALGSTANDSRGSGYVGKTHYVSISGLPSSTSYYLDIVSGSSVDDNAGAHYQVTTGPTLSIPMSDTAYGRVLKADGSTPATGAIVCLHLQDKDSMGSSGVSEEICLLVDSSGYWFTNLAEARTVSLSSYFSYSASGDNLVLSAQGASDGTGSLTIDTAYHTPTADIVLTPPVQQYTLTTSVVGNGSVTKNPDKSLYYAGEQVTLTATPDSGWTFSTWSGGATGSTNPVTITINANTTVTATFVQSEYILTVDVVGSGSVTKNPDKAVYHSGDQVTLTATPAACWAFSGWSGGTTGSTNPVTITIAGNTSVTATFVSNKYTLTTNVVGSGSVTKNPDKATYQCGDQVTLTAAPIVGWAFDKWSGDVTGYTNPVTITITGNTSVTATFTVVTYYLNTNVVGGGSITKEPDRAVYNYGDQVKLTAVPATGWAFSAWSGDIAGSTNPITITITGTTSVTATFVQPEFTLTINTVGNGSVTKDPDKAVYHSGDQVTLTAMPATGCSFYGWSGGATGSTNPVTITIAGNTTVNATFTQNEYTLTVNIAGNGSVTKNPDKATYHHGDQVTLTAVPVVGWAFDKWSGDVTGYTNPVTITISDNTNVTATFTIVTYYLTTNVVGSGSITKSPDKAVYNYGDQVTLTAVPTAGWAFSAWSGDITGSTNPVTITIAGTTSVTATFTQNEYTLTVTTVGSGSVTKDPDKAVYHSGEQVTLVAIPDTGWTFSGWSGETTGSTNPVTLTITGNTAVTATFTQNEYTLTINVVGSGSVVKSPDKAAYHSGDQVTLTAVPTGAGSIFSAWSGDVTGSTNPVTITITGNTNVTGTFIVEPYSLTTNVVGNGSITKEPDQAIYNYGDQVKLTAVPVTGWAFAGWSGDATGSTNPITITIANDTTITATFVQLEYTLTTNVVGSGSVTRDPDKTVYHQGDQVTLTAEPAIGWFFSAWSGGVTGSNNPVTITISGNTTTTAAFVQNEYTLTVNVVGSGSVTRDPDKTVYHYGDQVTLTAVPAGGWLFSAWSDNVTGTTNPVTITISGNTTVTATFVPQPEYSLTVNIVGTGSVTKDPEKATYHSGDQVTLTAAPAAGWFFSAWSGDATGSTNPISITISGNTTVTATFTQAQYTLTANTVGSGSVTKDPDKAVYNDGDQVKLTAVPATGWAFSGWSGDATGSTNPITTTITGNTTVTATFVQLEYTLTTNIIGSGSVTKDPDKAVYHYGDQVTLTAIPVDGWAFSAWSGDVTGSTNPVAITIIGNTSLTATFTQNEYTLTVTTVGNGSVSKNPDKAVYHSGDQVTLTAVPATGWAFSSWSGATTGSTNPVTITITGNTTVTATFVQIEYTLTVTTVGSGSVTKEPDKAAFHNGDQVTLMAVPNTGWAFSGWSGDVTGSTNPVTITITGNTTVTATFVQLEYTLTTNVVGSGSVTKEPDKAVYHSGDQVKLTAVPATGWFFSGWSGDVTSSNNPVTITIAGNTIVTATFVQQPEYTLTVTTVGSGSVTQNPDKATYHSGDQVTLTAVPATDWTFSGWSGDVTSGANPVTVTITGNTTVTATFVQSEYTLTVNVVGSGSVTKVPDQATYHSGDQVTLTAVPATGWNFSGWSGDLTGNTNPVTITIAGNTTVTATFAQLEYTLTTNVVGSGSVTKNPDKAVYRHGDQVTLTAVPAAGWAFSTWSGDAMGITNPVVITITANTNVTATFVQTMDELTLTVNVVGSGSVTKVPDKAVYHSGDQVTLTAVPVTGWVFSAWSGGATGSTNPVIITITGNTTVTATFVQQADYKLTIKTVGNGSVKKDPNKGSYHSGDQVTLTAVPGTGWAFSGWSGGATGSTNPVTITITGNATVTATFVQQAKYKLAIKTVGKGTVKRDPNKGYYYSGDKVTLTAVPANGWIFSGWSGDVTSSSNPVTITITDDTAVTATFTKTVWSSLFQDSFPRKDNKTIGNNWVEVEPPGTQVGIKQDEMCFLDTSGWLSWNSQPFVKHTFEQVSDGLLRWQYEFDWSRIGLDKNYQVFMQLGQGSLMSNSRLNDGVGVNLVWTRVGDRNQILGYQDNGKINTIQKVSGHTIITVVADLNTHTYDVSIDGVLVKTGIPFNKNVKLDTVRFLADSIEMKSFKDPCFDDLSIEKAG